MSPVATPKPETQTFTAVWGALRTVEKSVVELEKPDFRCFLPAPNEGRGEFTLRRHGGGSGFVEAKPDSTTRASVVAILSRTVLKNASAPQKSPVGIDAPLTRTHYITKVRFFWTGHDSSSLLKQTVKRR